jgi:hypothetical protein
MSFQKGKKTFVDIVFEWSSGKDCQIWLQKQCVELFCDGAMELYHWCKSVQLLGDSLEK